MAGGEISLAGAGETWVLAVKVKIVLESMLIWIGIGVDICIM